MPDLILHHYPTSPFAEKIRLILGYKKLAWKSVLIPPIMPKPKLMPLTGGYRRTPVLQIGADIYCDTALIADVLEEIAPTPTLYPAHIDGLARTVAQWADSTLFWNMIAYAMQPAAIQSVLGHMPPEQMQAFAADRAAMRGTNMPRIPLPEATGALTAYLRRLDNMLAGEQPYLLGAQPSIADFSVHHCLWFLQRAEPVAHIMDIAPRVKAWMPRIAAFGHHEFEKMSADTALEIAHDSEAIASGDAFFDDGRAALGDLVSIMPNDYGLDPVEGELVTSTEREVAVRRSHPEVGFVTVHFPRLGYQVKKH
jgi:glutathione S-transferase